MTDTAAVPRYCARCGEELYRYTTTLNGLEYHPGCAKPNTLRQQLQQERDAMRDEIERLRALTICGCGDSFTEHDPGTCVNCFAGLTAGTADYQRRNPLGGPANVFDACANAIRAGDSVEFAMANYGLAWAPKEKP